MCFYKGGTTLGVSNIPEACSSNNEQLYLLYLYGTAGGYYLKTYNQC